MGRSTQVARLRTWLEHQGHAVLDTGMARGALAGKGIQQAKEGNTLGPITMTLFYATDFAFSLRRFTGSSKTSRELRNSLQSCKKGMTQGAPRGSRGV